MGKYFTFLLVTWLVGLLVCVQRVAYWNGEKEDVALDWYNKPVDEKFWEGEEFLARQEADRKMGYWAAGMVLWGPSGFGSSSGSGVGRRAGVPRDMGRVEAGR